MKRIANIYIGLWSLYYLQGTLYETGSIYSKVILVVILALTVYYFIQALRKLRFPPVLKILTLLIGIWTIYGVINIVVGNGTAFISSFVYLKNILLSVMPIYVIYYFAMNNAISEKALGIWLIVFIPISIFMYNVQNARLIESALSIGMHIEEDTNNIGYVFLALLPLIPVYNKKPIIQYSIMAVSMLFVLMSMKRGAILIGAISVVWFIFVSMKSNQKQKKRGWRIVLTISLVLASIYAVQYFVTNSDYFNKRIEQTLNGDSSGRDVLMQKNMKYLTEEATFVDLMVGKGGDGTLRVFGQYSHDDWLEIAVDNGLVVVLLYFIFHLRMFFAFRKSRGNTIKYQMVGLFFIICFLKSIISMSYNDIFITSSMAIGYALAQPNMQESELKTV